MGVVTKLRIKYESALNTQLSTGSYFNLYYIFYRGLRVDPFIRLYPNGKAPKGLFLQGKAVAGYFNKNIDYMYIAGNDSIHHKKNTSFFSYGAGLGIGYQFIFKRSHKPLELFLGFQYSKYTAPKTIFIDNKEYYTNDDLFWYVYGPGSFLNANFGIGFTF